MLVLVGVLSAPLRRYTGAGLWALRVALTLAAVMILTIIAGLVGGQALLHYGLGLPSARSARRWWRAPSRSTSSA